MSDELESYNTELLLEEGIDLDQYKAYIAGVNVGMEAIDSGRLTRMTDREKMAWFVTQFKSRVEEE